jgi:hypothetical protein
LGGFDRPLKLRDELLAQVRRSTLVIAEAANPRITVTRFLGQGFRLWDFWHVVKS